MQRSTMHSNVDIPGSASAMHLPARRTVLVYGHDLVLLHSRKWLLQHCGCPSTAVTTDAEYRVQLRSEPPAVIILCQTLSSTECSGASAFAEVQQPVSRLLLLFTRAPHRVPGRRCNLLDSNSGPKIFSQTVFHLLYGRATVQNAAWPKQGHL